MEAHLITAKEATAMLTKQQWDAFSEGERWDWFRVVHAFAKSLYPKELRNVGKKMPLAVMAEAKCAKRCPIKCSPWIRLPTS